MELSKEQWKKPAIIRRSVSTGTVHTIYAETENNVKVFRCPFCSIQLFASQIKLRRHLKAEHGEFKTLIIDAPRPRIAEPLQFINLNSSVDQNGQSPLDNMVTPESNTAHSILVELDGGNSGDMKGLPQKRKNVDGKCMDAKKSRSELFDEPLLVNDRLGTEGLVNIAPTTVEEEDMGVFKDDIDQQLKLMFGTESRPETAGNEYCGVCSGVIGAEEVSDSGESWKNVVESVLGVEIADKSVCSMCDNLTTEIVETKEDLVKLQDSLNAAISKLRDLFQLGRHLLENDLEDGGFVEEEHIIIRLVQETRPITRSAKNLGFTVGPCFKGTIVLDDEVEDDGSPVEETQVMEEEACLFMTQEEWASSGLTVSSGRVQVPRDLVNGVALGTDRPRFSLSRGVCDEMGENTYICLDCDNTFPKLSELVEHSEHHEEHQTLNLNLEESDSNFFSRDDDFGQISDGIDYAEQDLVQKLNKLKENLEDQDSTRNRLEFKAYMHKEQYKEFLNEVPTLEKPFQCQECNKTFASAHELWGHQVSVGSQTFDCNYGDCKEIFLKLPDFAVHYTGHAGHKLVIPTDMKSKKVMNIICPICGTVVTGLYKLQRHKMKHDAELKYKCPACPKQFVKANTLRHHISNIHKGEKAEKACHLCDRVVYSSAGLSLHLKNSHGLIQDDFACSKCGLNFDSEQKLREHEKGHAVLDNSSGTGIEGTPYSRKCGKCDGAFPELDFIQHNEILMKTGTCPKKKTRRKQARQSCPECNQSLPEGESLSQHLKIDHPEESARFQCSECEGRLLTLQGCRKHYRLTHRGTPLTCLLCKETFSKEYSLHQHLATNHQAVLGAPPSPGSPVLCKFCDDSFNVFMEMVIHARFTHLVETIDITNTELEEVTMIGGHVVEFANDGVQIVALHTIP